MDERDVRGPFPGDPHADLAGRLEQIRAFWQAVYVGENPGETTWEDLGAVLAEVNSALNREPPDVTHAETLTAYAALLMTGQTNL
jgi:hypothetical protein